MEAFKGSRGLALVMSEAAAWAEVEVWGAGADLTDLRTAVGAEVGVEADTLPLRPPAATGEAGTVACASMGDFFAAADVRVRGAGGVADVAAGLVFDGLGGWAVE